MFHYHFLIAGLLFCAESALELQVPENFRPFRCLPIAGHTPDVRMEFLFDDGGNVSENRFTERYPAGGGGCFVREYAEEPIPLCRLHIPDGHAASFRESGKWLGFFPLERILLHHRRILLHASAVLHNGRAYLFSAPSGGGKSTHAALWQTHCGAQILNGDKVIVSAENGTVTAYGSPSAGSSSIYVNAEAPTAAIYMLCKANANRIAPLSARQALLSLYSEAVKQEDDPAFNSKLLDIVQDVTRITSVCMLDCLPDASAVEYVLDYSERFLS